MLRSALVFALALSLFAFAAAQSASDRASTGPLGTVAMPRDSVPAGDGSAVVSARIHLNASAAVAAGARHVLFGVGNDAAASLTVTIDSLATAAGAPVSPATVEGQGTLRAQWWLDPASLPAEVDLVLTATARPGTVATDVETLVMAFDAAYRALNASDGRPLTLQTFTSVTAASAPAPTNPPDPLVNDTNDPMEDDLNDTVPEESGRDRPSRIPALGAAGALAGVAAAAVALATTRGRRQ